MIARYLEQKIERSDGNDTSDEMDMCIDRESIAHVLQLLRSNLYANKISSPVREYASNAVDAHVEAGLKNLPIEIHIPTYVDPFFRVIDKGSGLTESEMEKVFRRFGKSTKRQNNDAIGCLGIGAKSAFCYTDSFLVTSKTARGTSLHITKYSCYIDESRVGKIAIMDRSDNPDHETGITIEIPVEPNDISAFKEAIFQQTQFFTPTPIYKEDEVEVKSNLVAPTLLVEGVWRIKDGFSSKVVMGGVAYPINKNNLKLRKEDEHGVITPVSKWRLNCLEKLLALNIVFEVPIGTVEVQASREELSYTPYTQKAILSRCYVAYKKLTKAMSAELAASPTVVDALFNKEHIDNKYGMKGADLTFEGHKISAAPDFFYRNSRTKIQEVKAFYEIDELQDVTDGNVITKQLVKKNCKISGKIRRPDDYGVGVGPNKDRKILPVFHDFKPNVISNLVDRIRTLHDNYYGRVILYTPPKKLSKGVKDTLDPKTIESISQQFTSQYFEFVFCSCFGLPADVIVGKTVEQLAAMFKQMGGFMLSEIIPTKGEKEQVEKAERVKSEKVDLLETSIVTLCNNPSSGITLKTALETFKNDNVVYWFKNSSYEYNSHASTEFKLITKKLYDGTVTSQVRKVMYHISTSSKITPLMIQVDLSKADTIEALLPPNWKPGQEYLRTNLDTLFPETVQYYMGGDKHYFVTRYVWKDFLRRQHTEEPFSTLHAYLDLMDVMYGIKFLLLPHPKKDYRIESSAGKGMEYRLLLSEYNKEIFPKDLENPLKEFPLLEAMSGSERSMEDYINLVLENKKMKERIDFLEMQSNIITQSLSQQLPLEQNEKEEHQNPTYSIECATTEESSERFEEGSERLEEAAV
jgi:hypothetical protein